jgi:superfamily II DNA or RNA helicase
MRGHAARLTFAGGTLLLEHVPAQAVAQHFPAGWWAWDPRVRGWRSDAIRYRDVRERLVTHRAAIQDMVAAWQPVRCTRGDIAPLRPEQLAAVAAWLRTQRGVIVMPTGTGKTEVALEILRRSAVSTLVVSPIRDLMYQWHRRIERALGYDAGIIGDNLFQVRPVSVTTYESAAIHMDKLGNRFALVVFDECHHLPGAVRSDAARMSAAPMRLELTATPERSDGRHADLDDLIGPIAYSLPLAAVRGTTLADYEVVRVPIHLSKAERRRYETLGKQVQAYMAERRRSEAGFSWQDLCSDAGSNPAARAALRAYFEKKAIEDRAAEKLRVLEDLFRLHAGTPTLVFAGSNAMAREVSRRFLIPCLLNHCRKRERHEVLEGFAAATYPAVVANRVLDEGVDLPEAKVAVVLGGSASTRQAKQRLGRVLRKTGGTRALLYEVVSADTNEEERSRERRTSDAYAGTRHRRL